MACLGLYSDGNQVQAPNITEPFTNRYLLRSLYVFLEIMNKVGALDDMICQMLLGCLLD
jgi:hypothetical protein